MFLGEYNDNEECLRFGIEVLGLKLLLELCL